MASCEDSSSARPCRSASMAMWMSLMRHLSTFKWNQWKYQSEGREGIWTLDCGRDSPSKPFGGRRSLLGEACLFLHCMSCEGKQAGAPPPNDLTPPSRLTSTPWALMSSWSIAASAEGVSSLIKGKGEWRSNERALEIPSINA